MMSYTLIIVVACYFIYIAFTIFVGLYRGDREVHWYHILIAVLLIIAGVGALIYTYKKYRAGEITNYYPPTEEDEETADETAEETSNETSEEASIEDKSAAENTEDKESPKEGEGSPEA